MPEVQDVAGCESMGGVVIHDDLHWPLPKALLPTCDTQSSEVAFSFKRERVTCETCKAWLLSHPEVQTWECEVDK